MLGERAVKCRAFAKALHYKEEEFHSGPTADVLESLIRCVVMSAVAHQHWRELMSYEFLFSRFSLLK